MHEQKNYLIAKRKFYIINYTENDLLLLLLFIAINIHKTMFIFIVVKIETLTAKLIRNVDTINRAAKLPIDEENTRCIMQSCFQASLSYVGCTCLHYVTHHP